MSTATLPMTTLDQLEAAVAEALQGGHDDSTCVICDKPATVVMVMYPCGHRHPLCTIHRAITERLYVWLTTHEEDEWAGCGLCMVPISGFRIEPVR